MEKSKKHSFPGWIFAIIAIGGLVACGIFVGIMSVEGVTSSRFIQAIGFGLIGLATFWGAIQR